jgi:hypothetical protein
MGEESQLEHKIGDLCTPDVDDILILCWGENLPRRGANSRNELTRKETKGNTYNTEEQETKTRLSVMQPSRLPIAPISLQSGPFYRPVTITLYNTCHRFFTLCEESQGHFGNLAGHRTHELYRLSLYISLVHVFAIVAGYSSLASMLFAGFSLTLSTSLVETLLDRHLKLCLQHPLGLMDVFSSKLPCLFSQPFFFTSHLRPPSLSSRQPFSYIFTRGPRSLRMKVQASLGLVLVK